MEHRWGHRVEVDIPIKLTARPFAVRSGRIVNLSVSGAFVKVSSELRTLSRIQLVIEMPLRFRHATPVLSAYVARKYKDGIGIEWCDFAPKSIVELLRGHVAMPMAREEFAMVDDAAGTPSDAFSAHALLLKHGT